METVNYIPHSLITNITSGSNITFKIWINTSECTYGTNMPFTTDANGITGIFHQWTEKVEIRFK